MDLTNRDRITKAFEYLQSAMRPFVEGEARAIYGDEFSQKIDEILGEKQLGKSKDRLADPAALLVIMRDRRFQSKKLGKRARGLVREVLALRGRWAHFEEFSNEDTEKALDAVARLLAAIAAPQLAEIHRMKGQLRRVIFNGIARVIPNIVEDGKKVIRVDASWTYQNMWREATHKVELCFYDNERTERKVWERRSTPSPPAQNATEGSVYLTIMQTGGFVAETDLPRLPETLNYRCYVKVLVRYEDRPPKRFEELWRSDDFEFIPSNAPMPVPAFKVPPRDPRAILPGSVGAPVRPKR